MIFLSWLSLNRSCFFRLICCFWVNVLLVLLLIMKMFLVCLLIVVILVSLRVMFVFINVCLILVNMSGVFSVFSLIKVVFFFILKNCILVGIFNCFICWGNLCLFLCVWLGFLSCLDMVVLREVIFEFDDRWELLFFKISMLLNM